MMTVRNNRAAAKSLGELNKNRKALSKALAKVATGQKYNNAGDGASEYSISEKMRAQIRALGQDLQNTQNGSSLLKIAEGGVQNIIDELRTMREKALDAANDHNTDSDRATLQKEYKQRYQNIEDLVNTTAYNGKLILNGDYRKKYTDINEVTKTWQEQIGSVTEMTRVKTGENIKNITLKTPSVTLTKGVDGIVIMQNNELGMGKLTNGLSVAHNSATERANATSYEGVECAKAFMGNSSWRWGKDATKRTSISATDASAIDVMKAFMSSLDNSGLRGTAALNAAINNASGGKFTSLAAAQSAFLSDLRASSSYSDFLQNKCAINLYNTDTGSVSGSDANPGGTTKTAVSIVDESPYPMDTWGMPPEGGTTTIEGLTFHWPTTGAGGGSFSAAEQTILKGLRSAWAAASIKLIKESFGLSFDEAETRVNDINVKFENTGNNALAYVSYRYYDSDAGSLAGQAAELNLVINMDYYSNISATDENGDSQQDGAGYLDRTLAHEFVHAVMATNIEYFAELPLYISEGTAELVHGIDDERNYAINQMGGGSSAASTAASVNTAASKFQSMFNTGGAKLTEEPYAGGYVFLRYLTEQSRGGETTVDEGDDITYSSAPTTGKQIAVNADFSYIEKNDGTQAGINDLDGEGFAIVCGGCSQFINFTFDASLTPEQSTFSRSSTDEERSDYVIGISGLTDTSELADAIFRGVSSIDIEERRGPYGAGAEDITVTEAATSVAPASTYLGSVLIDGDHGVRIAVDPEDKSKFLFIKNNSPLLGFVDAGTILAVASPDSEIEGLTEGVNTITTETSITVKEPIYEYKMVTTPVYTTVTETYNEETERDGKALYIQTGARSNQNIAVFIEDMHPDAMNLGGANISTRNNAVETLGLLDDALEYALDVMTNLGAYRSRFEHTENNLVTAQENTTAGESTIRDADMAKAMTYYTKSNVLAQSAQSMLAQANQNAGSVLSLLQ